MSREAVIALVLGMVIGFFACQFLTHVHTQDTPLPAASPSANLADADNDGEQGPRIVPAQSIPTHSRESWDQETERPSPETVTELREDNEALQDQVLVLLEWIDANLPEQGQKPYDTALPSDADTLTEDRRLTDEAAAALGLSDGQRMAVDEALSETYGALSELRDEHMRIRQRRNNRLEVSIPRLTEEGSALKSSLERTLKSELGDERYNAFLESSWRQLEKDFHYFGQARQTIRFRSFIDDNGVPSIRISDRYYFSHGDGNRTIYHQRGTHTNLPEAYQQYIEWER